ncbi:Cathepsin propeptide inhibitor domain-containing protein [Plasmodiophora brassicae]|uniref:Cathepsin propeptide inhibitor domain-containing protein n=1 Tax=Plasmodiophora brassicae TaxID=37360 RepID=A0A3P3YP59_PLABS|nr:unnamed protein product [Plasmodiophora brassicae]
MGSLQLLLCIVVSALAVVLSASAGDPGEITATPECMVMLARLKHWYAEETGSWVGWAKSWAKRTDAEVAFRNSRYDRRCNPGNQMLALIKRGPGSDAERAFLEKLGKVYERDQKERDAEDAADPDNKERRQKADRAFLRTVPHVTRVVTTADARRHCAPCLLLLPAISAALAIVAL